MLPCKRRFPESKVLTPYKTLTFFISIEDAISDKLSISCGVLQGSVLWPLLFLRYINDLPNCSNLLDVHLFVEDSNFFLSDKKLMDHERIVNGELLSANDWMTANKLTSSPGWGGGYSLYSDDRDDRRIF